MGAMVISETPLERRIFDRRCALVVCYLILFGVSACMTLACLGAVDINYRLIAASWIGLVCWGPLLLNEVERSP